MEIDALVCGGGLPAETGSPGAAGILAPFHEAKDVQQNERSDQCNADTPYQAPGRYPEHAEDPPSEDGAENSHDEVADKPEA